MDCFIDEDFLLKTDTAKVLYHEFAAKMPIYDYHCHLSPLKLYLDKSFKSITDAWINGDICKWRFMRECGVLEEYITGDKSDKEKFFEFARVLPLGIGNPVYHWSHLELKRFFDIDDVLNEKTAKDIWLKANKTAKTLSPMKIIEKSNVKLLCTTDDPMDSLEFHNEISQKNNISVIPTFSPGRVIDIPCSTRYANDIGSKSLVELEDTLIERMDFFHDKGCRIADHELEVMPFSPAVKKTVERIYNSAKNGDCISEIEIEIFKTHMLTFCAKEYKKRGWIMQFHLGGKRNNNTHMLRKIGENAGFDAIAQANSVNNMARFWDDLGTELPKTILYTLNPKDNHAFAAIAGSFGVKIGTAGWFNGDISGMTEQMKVLSCVSAFGKFLGMTTDSHSCISYVRHEYFRRILCNYIGGLVENGEYPWDKETLGGMIENICCNNAKSFFNF